MIALTGQDSTGYEAPVHILLMIRNGHTLFSQLSQSFFREEQRQQLIDWL
jgi:hypothetical protein